MRKRWKLWVGIFAALSLLMVWSWMEFVFLGRREMLDSIREWRDAGGAMTIQAMTPENVPPEQNAALALYQAFGAMPITTRSQQHVIENPYDGGRLDDVVSVYARPLDMTHEALKLPLVSWPLVYSDGQATQRPHIEPARVMSRVLVVEALDRQAGKNPDMAMSSIETGVRLGDSLLADPNLFTVVAQRDIQDAMLTAYERIFRDKPAPASDLEAMLNRRDCRAEFRRGLMAEGAVWLGQISGEVDPTRPEETYFTTSSIRGDTATYLRALRGYGDAFAAPHASRFDVKRLPPTPAWAFLLKSLRANFGEYNRALTESEARLVLAKLAIRLRAYKGTHGRYPATLDVLGEVPSDPWDSKPIRYEAKDEGFTAWSLTPPTEDPMGRTEWRWEK